MSPARRLLPVFGLVLAGLSACRKPEPPQPVVEEAEPAPAPAQAVDSVHPIPQDPPAQPGFHLKEYTEVRLPVMLEAVDAGQAQLRRLEGDERVESVKVGDTVTGMRWKVEKMARKHDIDKAGEPVDLSSVTLVDLDTKERMVLKKGLPARTSASFADLVGADGQTVRRVKQDEVFEWPSQPGAAFKVIDLRADQVVLQELATGRMVTVLKAP